MADASAPNDRDSPDTLSWVRSRDRRAGVVVLFCGLVGAGAALALAVEKFRVLTNPFYVPSCTVNEKVSCLSVMTSPQAEVLGFPNPLLGLIAFGALAAAGAAVLASPRPLASWFWAGLQGGTAAGLVFVHWLAWQSSVVIGALCPYCIAVWIVTITAFVHVTARNAAARKLATRDASGGAGAGGPGLREGRGVAQPLATSPAVISVLWVLVLLSAAVGATTLLGR
ncbi:vitamin K epoxide reductase family protein [Microlunatus antarcticus]